MIYQEALDRLERRLKRVFTDRFVEVVDLDGNPFEPETGEFWVGLVLRDEGYDHVRDDRLATDAAMAISDALDYRPVCHIYVLSESELAGDSAWARAARTGEVLA